jgi:hypothetical protein
MNFLVNIITIWMLVKKKTGMRAPAYLFSGILPSQFRKEKTAIFAPGR